jgi:hypothetical protein
LSQGSVSSSKSLCTSDPIDRSGSRWHNQEPHTQCLRFEFGQSGGVECADMMRQQRSDKDQRDQNPEEAEGSEKRGGEGRQMTHRDPHWEQNVLLGRIENIKT